MTKYKRSTLHFAPLVLSSLLLFGAAFIHGLPYQYFSFLRLFVSVTSIYAAYKSFKSNNNFSGWVYVFILILFNPIVPFTFPRTNWILIDQITAIIFLTASFGGLILTFFKKVINSKTYKQLSKPVQMLLGVVKLSVAVVTGTCIVVGVFWVIWGNIEYQRTQKTLAESVKNTTGEVFSSEDLGFDPVPDSLDETEQNKADKAIKAQLSDTNKQTFDYGFLRMFQGSSSTGFNWVKMTKEEKKFYLMGYEDGNLNALAFNIKDKRIRDVALGKLPSFIGNQEDVHGTLIPKINDYYGQHVAYKVLPIPLVIRIIVNKELGITDDVIDEQFRFYQQELENILRESSKVDAGFAK